MNAGYRCLGPDYVAVGKGHCRDDNGLTPPRLRNVGNTKLGSIIGLEGCQVSSFCGDMTIAKQTGSL